MKPNSAKAIDTLVNIALHSDNGESFNGMITEHSNDFIDALQYIGDNDKEEALECSFYSLYLASGDNDEFDTHIQCCLNAYLQLITAAFMHHDGNVRELIEQEFDLNNDEQQVDNILHLEKCLMASI